MVFNKTLSTRFSAKGLGRVRCQEQGETEAGRGKKSQYTFFRNLFLILLYILSKKVPPNINLVECQVVSSPAGIKFRNIMEPHKDSLSTQQLALRTQYSNSLGLNPNVSALHMTYQKHFLNLSALVSSLVKQGSPPMIIMRIKLIYICKML